MTQDAQAARKLELYMLVAGKSSLRVSYEPQAKQEEMSLEEAKDKRQMDVPLQ